MAVPGALQWWEDWQLRILVLGSLVVQYILLVASFMRKYPVRSWFRPIIWLAYLGSDAIAIYALAALFNRHRKPHDTGEGHGGSSRFLEVLWAPILLIHLGGQDGITAYNIEDNELWMRHILTGVSQVTVTVYVFCKSWPGGDTNLLIAAILLFIHGILKCIEKPWALYKASINSLVSSGQPIRRSVHTQKLNICTLEDFIDKATSPAGAKGHLLTAATPSDFTPYELFVDLASPFPYDRMRMLQSFSELDDNQAYCKLQYWLSKTFRLLYTKQKMFRDPLDRTIRRSTTEINFSTVVSDILHGGPFLFSLLLRMFAVLILCAAVALFHHSHREAFSRADDNVTYALLCCTAILESYSYGLGFLNMMESEFSFRGYNHKVYQCNLIGFLVRNRENSMMRVVGFLGCDDFLNQHWHMKSCSSSFSITKLVLKYVKSGWVHHIRDVSSYRKFNENRGQFTLDREGCYQELGWVLEGAFDESVLLWHLATDFCYYDKGASYGPCCTQDSCSHVYLCPAWCEGSDHHKRGVQCREMSNYMMHLLFVNPEMLMAGTRRNRFTAAYEELKSIVGGRKSPAEETEEIEGIMFKGDKQSYMERELSQRIIAAVDGEGGSPPPDGIQDQPGGIIRDAWSIAKVLSRLPEEKMWDVIEGVWVEMLCFSAARCRGYLHAKGLATGIEYLTFVWLLQYYMGMETLAAKLQRVDHHHERSGVGNGDDPSTSGFRMEATGKEQHFGPSSSGATSQENTADQWPHHGSNAIEEEIV